MPEFLRASLLLQHAAAQALLGASVPENWVEEPRILLLRLVQMDTDPKLEPWLMRAMVLRSEKRMVGHIGFHTAPGPEYLARLAPGGVELGYTVFAADRRRGYAREACGALMNWAHESHGVHRFVVSISAGNTASLELARGLGFQRIGSHVDAEDGPEDIFERRHPHDTTA